MSYSTTLISLSILGTMGPSRSIPWDSRSKSECGRVFRTNGSPRLAKIMAGEDAHPDEFPWMVSIKSKNTIGNNGGHICGGFVINNRHIVSAAHCFRRKYNRHLDYSDDGTVVPGSMIVSLGQFDLTSHAKSQNVTIEYLALHPDFELGGHLNHDIAILRTEHEIIWETNLSPICLPESNDSEYFNHPVTVAGWGNTNCQSLIKPSKNLKKVSIPVWKNNDCLQAYKEAHYDFTREGYVCAGDFEKDSSKGDSGSPLMILQDNKWTAIGIVSAGRFMCEDRVPGVYTKISSYISWLNSEIII